jgi:atypical dual specificity phosphatase
MLLMLDEPTSGMSNEECAPLLSLIGTLRHYTTLLVALHNQEHARLLAQNILLLAGGRIQADLPANQFLDNPVHPLVAHFVKTGSCALPAPDAQPEDLAEDVSPPPPLSLIAQIATRVEPEYRGPAGFKWIIPGRLAAAPKPGAVVGIDYDLAILRLVGVTTLITLTEDDLPQDSLKRHGLRNLHLSIEDRKAPMIWHMRMLAMRIQGFLKQGEVVAVHCLAGIGRTGTIIAAWLISEGLTADAAMERIRKIDPAFVQSKEQENFLYEFETALLVKMKSESPGTPDTATSTVIPFPHTTTAKQRKMT